MHVRIYAYVCIHANLLLACYTILPLPHVLPASLPPPHPPLSLTLSPSSTASLTPPATGTLPLSLDGGGGGTTQGGGGGGQGEESRRAVPGSPES